MEKECLILGKVNVGKTLFTLNFAEFLGLKEIEIFFENPSGQIKRSKYSVYQAKRVLIDSKPHKTRCLQKVILKLKAGKGKKEVILADSSGLIDGIHEDKEIRQAIAQTLLEIKKAPLILHVLDASVLAKCSHPEEIGEIDFQILNFAELRGGYAILANKIDLPDADYGLAMLKKEFPTTTIIPISAKLKTGFKEVKAFVNRNI